MKTYELTYIITPEITSEEAEAKAREIEAIVQNKEGIILGQINPVAKTLSYPVKKHASGFVGVLEFQLEPEKVGEVEKLLSKEEKINRHLLTIKKAVKARKEEFKAEKIEEKSAEKTEKPEKTEEKIELKDIEQKIDEILGQ